MAMLVRKAADRLMLRALHARAGRDRARLQREDFTVLANDCWGGEVYRHLGLPYATPLVGLFLPAPDFVTLLEDPRRWIEQEPFTWAERSRHDLYAGAAYPIGILGGELEVHFVHHPDAATAEASWRRRAERVNWGHLCAKLSADKDLCTPGLVARFDALEGMHRVCLTRRRYPQACALRVPGHTDDGAVLFRYSVWRFDLARWLDTGAL